MSHIWGCCFYFSDPFANETDNESDEPVEEEELKEETVKHKTEKVDLSLSKSCYYYECNRRIFICNTLQMKLQEPQLLVLFFKYLTLSWQRSLSQKTSPLIRRANQWTGFFMLGTSTMKALNHLWPDE